MAYEGVITETVVGTGADIDVELGFAPSRVQLLKADGATLDWIPAMGDGFGMKTLTTVAPVMLTTLGISAYPGVVAEKSVGFTIGADTDLNVDAEVIYYTAFY